MSQCCVATMQAPEAVRQKLLHYMQSGGQYTPTQRSQAAGQPELTQPATKTGTARLMFSAEKRLPVVEKLCKVVQASLRCSI